MQPNNSLRLKHDNESVHESSAARCTYVYACTVGHSRLAVSVRLCARIRRRNAYTLLSTIYT